MTAIYAVLHFMVDGLCICALYLLSGSMSFAPIATAFLLYNVLAFLTQPLTGMVSDRLKHRHWLLLTAMVLLALAVLITGTAHLLSSSTGMLAVATLLGLGNSLFHVWGGKQTAVETDNDIWSLGVFVSTGALGLSVGALLCSWALLYVLLIGICVAGIVVVRNTKDQLTSANVNSWRKTLRPIYIWTAVVVLIAIVAFRSWVGGVFTSDIVRTDLSLLGIGISAMLGKMAGGWISLRLGLVRAVAIMVAVVAGCLICMGDNTLARYVGLFAVNCTMPVTLYLANAILPGREGLAFGLLAAALMPAYLIVFL
jgi:predicted MFS family arabinose efflux permease